MPSLPRPLPRARGDGRGTDVLILDKTAGGAFSYHVEGARTCRRYLGDLFGEEGDTEG